MSSTERQAKVVAVLAASFPSRSETFVYREVRELRRRGWLVHAVSLNEPERGLPELQEFERGLRVVSEQAPGLLALKVCSAPYWCPISWAT